MRQSCNHPHDPRQPLGYSLLKIGLVVTTIPLLLGGLIAAGESKDGSVLLFGAVSLLTLAIVRLKQPPASGEAPSASS